MQPMARAPPGPGAHRRGAGAGGSTGSRAAAPAALQRRGCLRSAPLPPPLSIPPRGSIRRRRRRRRRRLAPPPGLGWRRRGGGGPGIGCARRLPAPALDPAAALRAHLAALPSARRVRGPSGAPRPVPAGLASGGAGDPENVPLRSPVGTAGKEPGARPPVLIAESLRVDRVLSFPVLGARWKLGDKYGVGADPSRPAWGWESRMR
ncbi:translation initiation factor IF-2-like [Lutra lutra]|uniref:translation initiation factor IF-2-like n=1 Tax=Lutra lutra TaxID=9657 RepID=UPI001FD06EA9|nr:translation initiation factor IF-2-like [Lutra lutra]